MLKKLSAMVVAGVIATGTGGVLAAQPAQAQPTVAVPCSVQALASAVASAASGTTLNLAADCLYNLKAALPEVSQVLTITGNGATLQRSHAAGTAAFTLVTVAGPGILTVNELNFRNGDGAIAVIGQGQLTVNGGTFTGNTAADGGAIYSNADPYAPQINDATFVRNTATDAGGAIYNTSPNASVSVNGCVFTGNTAADGGAIWEYGIGGSINSSTFQDNSALERGGALSLGENDGEFFSDVVVRDNSTSGDGGGIYAGEGGVGGAYLDDSTVSDNHAGGDGGGLFDGGGEQSEVIGSHIQGNSAADGGGIYNDSNAVFRLMGSTVSDNHATADGGGIYDASYGGAFLTTGTVSGNRAGADGGGIYNEVEEFNSLTTSTLSGNRAAGYGGGIYNQAYSQVSATSTDIIRNSAPSGGGGIYDESMATVSLTTSPVTGNKPDNCEPPGSITGCTG